MTSFLNDLRHAAAAAALFGLASLGMTGSASADDLRIDDAWKAALADFEGVLTEKQHALVNSIAYHSAAARLCDGIDLDVTKVGASMNEIVTSGDPAMTDEEHIERLSNVLLTLGTAKGIFLAEGALHKEAFCADAAASKADPENIHFWQ
ncbi:hypothetical protein [Aestuariivirga sp.]|uniref:hypothetical protein n=1 Tax=Aestuariivirga sp. TaxID=2650926 RepID=UPI00359377BF